MRIDYKSVLGRAEFYKPAISRFLRDMIAIPSESCQEKEVIQRIKKEMHIRWVRQGGNRPHGQHYRHDRKRQTIDRLRRSYRHSGRRQYRKLGTRPLPGIRRRRDHHRPRRQRSGRGHGGHGLCRQNHQGSRIGRRLYPSDDRYRAGRGLRRSVLAVSHRGESYPSGVRGVHRTDFLSHTSGPERPDGNQGRGFRIECPWVGSGKRRQRHLQDGADTRRTAGAARKTETTIPFLGKGR